MSWSHLKKWQENERTVVNEPVSTLSTERWHKSSCYIVKSFARKINRICEINVLIFNMDKLH